MTKTEWTASVEDYLKTLYAIEAAAEAGTTGNIADRLDVSPASVTAMLQRLAAFDPPLVNYEKRRGASLTDAGMERALEMVRHHRLIELFLHQVLGYRWDEVHEEAEKLEHVISEDLEERIARYLGDPTEDPHGDPIPARDGSMPGEPGRSLVRMETGARGEVVRVADAPPEMLRYLSTIGIEPGTTLVLLAKGPFDGPYTVRIGEERNEASLSRTVAERLHVREESIHG